MASPWPARAVAFAALLAAGAVAAAAAAAPRSAAPGAPAAQVIYRCVAANGAVALQDDPCPPGQREERRELAAFTGPARAPEAAAQGAQVAPEASADADRPAATATPTVPVIEIKVAEAPPRPRRPTTMPPPLWRCTDLNGASRLVDTFDPQPRCVPLSVLGVDLRGAPPAAAGLCRMVEDECVELGGDAACAAWEERLAEAVSANLHAFSDEAAERRRALERARAVVENDCR